MKLLDGKKTAKIKEGELVKRVKAFKKAPELAIILVGEREDSKAYVKQKIKTAGRIGIKTHLFSFEEKIKQEGLIEVIKELNLNKEINGIIVQMPLPSHLNTRAVLDTISPTKDVDGLTTLNQGKILTGDSTAFIPATARGIISLLTLSNISLLGKRVTVLGRSLLVGRPVALLAERFGATVIQCHSKTKKLDELTKLADILIVAIGKPKFINSKFVKKGQVVVDVGITVQIKKGQKVLAGDVDFEKVSKIVKAISPVPGGVGPMTVISLLENVCDAREANLKSKM
jgi:methylenetetrahydrofolate dehydrogenase (NADP+) / methenyltetrahydrofolate cyclohydrolase